MGERSEEAAQCSASRFDALRMLPQVDEHLLGDVFRGLLIDECAHRQRVDERRVAVVEVGQRRLVAVGQALDQDLFGPLAPDAVQP